MQDRESKGARGYQIKAKPQTQITHAGKIPRPGQQHSTTKNRK